MIRSRKQAVIQWDIKEIKIAVGLGIISSIFVIAAVLIFPDLFRDMELKIYDYRMRARGKLVLPFSKGGAGGFSK